MSAELGLGTIAFIAPATGLGPGIPSVLAPLRMGPGPCSTHGGPANAAAPQERANSDVMSRIDFWFSICPPKTYSCNSPGANRARVLIQILCQRLSIYKK